MTINEYQELALRTAPPRISQIEDLEHAAMGLCTEAGELLDPCKKHLFYGKPIDWTHIVEEAGDSLWYAALVARAAGVPLEEIAKLNIAKLRCRYPVKFDEGHALNRDIKVERGALEG